MPEPTSTATYAATTLALPALTAFGVLLGLRPELLIAGFSGSLTAIILLNSVPGTGDTWPELIRTTLRRMAVTLASSLTAGYLTPLAMLLASVPHELLVGSAFAIGGGAQQVLTAAIRRIAGQSPATTNSAGGQHD